MDNTDAYRVAYFYASLRVARRILDLAKTYGLLISDPLLDDGELNFTGGRHKVVIKTSLGEETVLLEHSDFMNPTSFAVRVAPLLESAIRRLAALRY
jgi:hypothetical protein